MTASSTTLAVIRNRYLCCYGEEIDALQLCHALHLYGIEAEMRVNHTVYRADCEWFSYSVWILNGEEYDRALEFKRGLLTSLAIKGDPAAFIDGVMAGALMRNQKRKKKMVESSTSRRGLETGLTEIR